MISPHDVYLREPLLAIMFAPGLGMTQLLEGRLRKNRKVCPLCEAGRLHSSDRGWMICESCGGGFGGPMLETLRRISSLQDVLGKHTCECGHPAMRRLPDGTYHLPGCSSEVLAVDATSSYSKPSEHSVV